MYVFDIQDISPTTGPDVLEVLLGLGINFAWEESSILQEMIS